MPSCAFRPQRSAAPRAGHEGDAPERSFRIGARRSSGRSAPSASPNPDPKRAHSRNSPLPKTPYLPSPRTSSVRKSSCLPTAQKFVSLDNTPLLEPLDGGMPRFRAIPVRVFTSREGRPPPAGCAGPHREDCPEVGVPLPARRSARWGQCRDPNHLGGSRRAVRAPSAGCAGPHREDCPEVGVPLPARRSARWRRCRDPSHPGGSQCAFPQPAAPSIPPRQRTHPPLPDNPPS